MAGSVYKAGKKWRAQIKTKGRASLSKNFDTKTEAHVWLSENDGSQKILGKYTVLEAFERYAKDVSPTKRGEKWEVLRLAAFANSKLALLKLGDLTASDIAEWRDSRLKTVSAGTVLREANLIKSVFSICRREWLWMKHNPWQEVKMPKPPKHRNRRISELEIKHVAMAAGASHILDKTGLPENKSHRIIVAFLFALETAMRLGEICGLRSTDISGKSALIRGTKNGDDRYVPLSKEAIRLLGLLPQSELAFNLNASSSSTMFSDFVRKAGIEDLSFHDSRHEACTRLARKLQVLDLAKMIGHRDLKSLMIYYNPTVDELADRLD